jgi:hypothetical protein
MTVVAKILPRPLDNAAAPRHTELMTTTQTISPVTAELRRYFHIGPRTRRYRDGRNLHADMFEAIRNELHYPGYYSERTAQALRPAAAVLHAWDKFVEGYRLPGEQIYALRSLSPWDLAALVGRMVDAGITNNGEAERWFAENR